MNDGRRPNELPDDPLLAEVARALEDENHTAEVLDADWRIRYVTSELRHIAGVYDDAGLGYGTPSLSRMNNCPEAWRASAESGARWMLTEAPYYLHDRKHGARGDAWLDENLAKAPELQPADPPPAWSFAFETSLPNGLPTTVSRVAVRLRRSDGSLAGMAVIYVGGGLRASVQTMLTRGDPAMFERMIALVEPARRPAAVLFADLAASGVIARRLSTRAYFDLIRTITSGIDRAVIAEGGVIGKHVGDGVTAFFLAEHTGGEGPAAAAAAVRAAQRIASVVEAIDVGDVEARIKIGLHWGATLVIGQVTTEGRLEVTALGDEVNEAARVEQAAAGGQILATKSLLERLEPDDAARAGIDPETVTYLTLEQLPGAGEKVVRDAGGLAVAELPHVPPGS